MAMQMRLIAFALVACAAAGCASGGLSQLAPGANPLVESVATASPTPKATPTPVPTATPVVGGGLTVPPQYTYFTGPVGGSPTIITTGPDGNLWYTDALRGDIVKLTTGGTFTSYPVPGGGALDLNTIVNGPNGALWFAAPGANQIGTITTAGVVTIYTNPIANTDAYAIALGPDGNVWYAGYAIVAGAYGKVSPTGVFTQVTSAGIFQAYTMAAGPDGNLWIALDAGHAIVRVTPAGVATTFSLAPNGAIGITSGADGNLWFTGELSGNAIGRITPSGTVTEFPIGSVVNPFYICAGPDGNLWFTTSGGTQIGRVTPAGVVTLFTVPSGKVYDLTSGPDGNLWGTLVSGQIVRITP